MPRTSWPILLRCLERLRQLNTGGFTMGGGEWLIGVQWADGQTTGRTSGGTTACSPCAVQALVMAFATDHERAEFDRDPDHYRFPTLLPKAFNHAANGNLGRNPTATRSRDVRWAQQHGFDVDPVRDNHFAAAVAAFQLGRTVRLEDMKRGDCVGFNSLPTAAHPHGHGHVGFAWDVHYDAEGSADAVLIVAANGSGHAGAGVSVYGNPGRLVTGPGGGATPVYSAPDPYLIDDRAEIWVGRGTWLTWHDPATIDFTSWHIPLRRISQVASMHIARLNGVDGPPSMCMQPRGTGPPPTPHVQSVTPVEIDRGEMTSSPTAVADRTRSDATQSTSTVTEGQLRIEQWLQLLHEHEWIAADPGSIDGINDAHTQDALRDFQQRYFPGGRTDGTADADTRTHLRDYAQRAAQGESPPGTPAPPPTAPAPAVTHVAWSTVSAHPSDPGVRLLIRATGSDGRTLTVRFKNHDDHPLGHDETVSIADGRAAPPVQLADIVGTLEGGDVLEVDATVGGAGAEVTTGAPLRVEPASEVIAPHGKGTFMYWPSGATDREQRDDERAAAAQASGMTWVIIEARGPIDGPRDDAGHTTHVLSVMSQDRVNAAAAAYHEHGIEVWLWGWPGRPTRGQESEAIDDLVRLAEGCGARGIIVDVEEEYAPRQHGRRVVDHAHLAALAARLRRVVGDGRLGVGISTYLDPVASALCIPGAFLAPQWYHEHVYDLPSLDRDMARSASRYRKIVPTIPVWVHFQDSHWMLTPADLAAFLQHLDELAGSYPGQVCAVSAWVWEHQFSAPRNWPDSFPHAGETHAATRARWQALHVDLWHAWAAIRFNSIPVE